MSETALENQCDEYASALKRAKSGGAETPLLDKEGLGEVGGGAGTSLRERIRQARRA